MYSRDVTGSKPRDVDNQPCSGVSTSSAASNSGNNQSPLKCNGSSTTSISRLISPSGHYDAEKCRVYIANQTKVSKIDRFAAQISKADEVESELRACLRNILTIFLKQSAQSTLDFMHRCKNALKRHHQDRMILMSSSSQRKNSPSKFKNGPNELLRIPSSRSGNSVSEDLFEGPGSRLLHELLSSNLSSSKKDGHHGIHLTHKRDHNHHHHSSHQIQIEPDGSNYGDDDGLLDDQLEDAKSSVAADQTDWEALTEQNYLLSTTFEPASFVKKLEILMRNDVKRSESLSFKLNLIRQRFEKLAHKHRSKVDLVYAAEEERQSASVIRRSAYNLSVAAIKATSTPIHVQNPRYSSRGSK